jgi:glyoxylase-like metal-dependent hydrolase (beta-lactamase superfamily II)
VTFAPVRLDAANPGPLTGQGNNTWLLDGGEPLLVDAGVGHAAHVDAIAAALAGRPLARVVVTHHHPDHASGVPALRARWPAIEVCKVPTADDSGIRALADGDRVTGADVGLEVVHTPGHAPDHICLWAAGARALFTGDMLVKGSTVMIPAGRGGHLGEYLRSLTRLASLGAAIAYPGHGAVIDDPDALIAEYLAHRQLREDQVLACLARGVEDVDAMVETIYPDVSAAVRPAARVTVEAHLEKLREEGRLR